MTVRLTLLLVGLLLGAGTRWVQAEETPKDKPTVTKTVERLHFKVPADWPIEKRDGVTGPIPIEEYLAQKFKSLEASIQAIERRVNALDVRLRVLEEEAKKQRQALRSSEEAASP